MSNTQLATATPQRPSALRTMAARLNVDPEALLKSLKETVCKGCTDSELMAFSIVANEYQLNPFIKQIYAFPAKGGGIVPIVSIDGWVAMANNHPQMDGMEFEDEHDEKGNLISCTCSIYRKDRSRPVVVKEYLSECRRNSEPWKMEHRMLRHKSLIQCNRYAFGFSGVYDEDEAADIARNGGMRETTGRVVSDTNPYSDEQPAALPDPAAVAPAPAKKAPAKAKADKPAAATPPPVKMPPRTEMTPAIRQAYRDAGITVLAEAEGKIHAAGLMPQGKCLSPQSEAQKLTDVEMHRIYLVKDTIFSAQAPQAAPVVEAADDQDPGEDYPMDGDEGQQEGDQAS